MTDVPDDRLLEQFARNGSEDAFAALVQRHIALVHSVALRHTANPQHAEDITQAVFVILARKAWALGRKTVLPGWLYHTARLTAANLQRAEARRVRREQEAFMQSQLEESPTDNLWRELSPQLDEAMACLGTSERDALVLRYFQNKSMAEVAKFLGLEENTAQKRVSRAMEKLRKFFRKRGVDSNGRWHRGEHFRPFCPGCARGAGQIRDRRGCGERCGGQRFNSHPYQRSIENYGMDKSKNGIRRGRGCIARCGTTTVTVKEIRQQNLDSQWDTGRIDSRILDKAPRIVKIIPSRFPNQGGWARSNYRIIGIGDTAAMVVEAAYGARDTRTILLTKLPQGKYDFISNLPSNSFEGLKKEIREQLGVVGRAEMIETNVFFLKVKQLNAPGLKPTTTHDGSSSSGGFSGEYRFVNEPVSTVANLAENSFGIPVIDQTGLKRNFDVDLKWDGQNDPRHENLKQAIADQLGLELVPGTAPVEMLMVEKAK